MAKQGTFCWVTAEKVSGIPIPVMFEHLQCAGLCVVVGGGTAPAPRGPKPCGVPDTGKYADGNGKHSEGTKCKGEDGWGGGG